MFSMLKNAARPASARNLWLATTGLVLIAITPAGLASEGGSSHIIPGNAATILDLAPTTPGWVIEPVFLHYSGDASAAGVPKFLPNVGVVSVKLKADVDSAVLIGLNTLEQPVLGGSYSYGAAVSYVSTDIQVKGTVAGYTGSRKDSSSGIGDSTLIPVMLAWKDGPWNYNADLFVYAPTGSYSKADLANNGLNYWTIDPTLGLAYSNENTGFNATLFAGIGINSENPDTHYRSGSMSHVEGSLQQLLPLGPGYLGVGVEAFHTRQVSGDSGSGATLGDFKGRNTGSGPVLSYLLPQGKETLAVELKWLQENSTERQLQGNYTWLKMIYQFN